MVGGGVRREVFSIALVDGGSNGSGNQTGGSSSLSTHRRFSGSLLEYQVTVK